jgi:heme-degrading monooxygenase HmoA
MACKRVGVYALHGNPIDVVRQVTEEMLPVVKRQPGFIDDELITTGDKLISISTWRSREHATEGAVTAASFVREHLADHLQLEHSFLGEVAASSRGA